MSAGPLSEEQAFPPADAGAGGWMRRFDRIWWKLLVAFMLIAAICLAIVITVVYEVSTSSYNRHVEVMSRTGMGSMMSSPMMNDLTTAFRTAVNDSILWGSIITIAVAVALSFFISRRITRPVHDMAAATEMIAAGEYSQRVEVSSHDEIGSLAHSLNSMAARLQEAQKMRRELIANIAHELRTPLTTISGYMEGLADGVVPANAETYDTVRREALRLSRLVEDLQRLSRAESGQEELDLVPVDTAAFLERVTRRMTPQFKEKDVGLELEVSRSSPHVMADEDKLDQIMVNLLDNALRYTEAGGKVTVSSDAADGHAAIRVVDSGAGIEPADLPFIFERFYRADKSRARVSGGSGIGLTIVKRYVEALGGGIDVASRVGEGTTFTVILPVVPAAV